MKLLYSVERGSEVMQSLSHAHEHDVADMLAERGEQRELLHNLPGFEIPHQTHRPRLAESAAHRAAYLAGKACSISSASIGKTHAFDDVPIGEADRKLHCGISFLLSDDSAGECAAMLIIETLPESFRKGSHFLEAPDSLDHILIDDLRLERFLQSQKRTDLLVLPAEKTSFHSSEHGNDGDYHASDSFSS